MFTRFELMFEMRGAQVDEMLFGTLLEYVNGYLDAVERLIVADIRTEARRLAAAWRALLQLHRPVGRGGCTGCGRPRVGRTTSCAVWRVANAYFVHRLPAGGAT